MVPEPIIGVIGGMGPYAGADLVRKIFDLTEARRDQDHLPVALLSYPGWIRDRSAYLFGDGGENPADAIARIALRLDGAGATVIGIPCNTAHAPAIYDVIEQRLRESGSVVRVLHMIRETGRHVRTRMPDLRRIGILSTLAVYRLQLYSSVLIENGLEPVVPDENVQEHIINRTIFDETYGIKAQANPVSLIARQSLENAIDHLREKGAEAVVLGCTELPLALPEREIDSTPIIDPTEVLARALVRATYPDRVAS